MKKLWAEFKAFVSRGNVMDLAVGMIIGSAFTAIINSLVKNILTPLINAIPGTGSTGALQTVLREAVTDESGNIVTQALILDWGAVISAVFTFFCTAVVLFLIVKAFNKIRETGSKIKVELKQAAKSSDKDGESADKESVVAEIESKEDAEAEVAVAAAEVNEQTSVELLKQIVELLKEQKEKDGN